MTLTRKIKCSWCDDLAAWSWLAWQPLGYDYACERHTLYHYDGDNCDLLPVEF